jgi:predicted nucleic acid-binding protein
MENQEGARLLIDTSISLEYLLDQERADETVRMLSTVSPSRPSVTEHSLGSIAVILEASGLLPDHFQFVRETLRASAVERTILAPQELLDLKAHVNEYRLDFDDAPVRSDYLPRPHARQLRH